MSSFDFTAYKYARVDKTRQYSSTKVPEVPSVLHRTGTNLLAIRALGNWTITGRNPLIIDYYQTNLTMSP